MAPSPVSGAESIVSMCTQSHNEAPLPESNGTIEPNGVKVNSAKETTQYVFYLINTLCLTVCISVVEIMTMMNKPMHKWYVAR